MSEGDVFTIPGVHAVIRVGDTFTIRGGNKRNPDRWWFQFWKPKWVRHEDLKQFRVVRHVTSHD
jgi:hypothetical protein